LVRIERHVPLLPVPSSRGKNRLLAQILNEGKAGPAPAPARAPAALPLPLPSRWQNPQFRLAAAAAAIFLALCGVYLGILLSRGGNGNDEQVKGPDQEAPKVLPNKQPLIDRVLDCDVRLAEADTPRKRVETLAELADALHRETHTLTPAAPAKDLQELASLYERVIRDGVVPRARTLPVEERREVLDPIRTQLARVERDAHRLAEKASSATPLLQIAAAAKKGDQQLRALMEEAQ
jgi:hypothetical protein